MEDIETLVRQHPGIVCVSVPTLGQIDIAYDPQKISRRHVREFASHTGGSLETHVSRCTMPLQGRACETCAVRIQSRLANIPGVRHATASFLNGSLSVVFDHKLMTPAEVVAQAKALGAPLKTSREYLNSWVASLRALDSNRGQSILLAIATVALVIGAVLSFTDTPPLFRNIAWAIVYLTAGYGGMRASIQSLRMGVLDIDVLMVLAAIGAAFINAQAEGALLLFLFSLSNLLQEFAVGKARSAIAALLDLRPAVALVKDGDTLTETPVEDIAVGTTIILRPGERIPLDGDVISGSGAINQAPITGESMPVEKSVGDPVFAGTLNHEGSLEVRVTHPAEESTLARMISLVEAAQSEKATTQQFLEKAEQYYAGGVIGLTFLLALAPPLLGFQTFAAAFYRAMAVMVVASPCALVLSTPAAILSAIAGLGRRGILVKGGRHLEDASTIRAVAFDKTGTLTVGKPSVTDIVPLDKTSATATEDMLSLAAQAEVRSQHPLADAVIREAEQRGLAIPPPASFSSITGRGGEATLADGTHVLFGSLKLMENCECQHLEDLREIANKLESEGKTVICIAREDHGKHVALGALGLQDILRPDAVKAVKALRRMGINRIVMLSGDTPGVASAVAAQAGITEVHGGLMPQDKVRLIKEIAEQSPVIMVGDGINDAPALAAANLGVAMGAAGTDVAMETADVVLMSHDLQQIATFLQLSQKARRVILQNLVFATAVVVVLLVAALGFSLKLSLGVLGHEGSTVLVCLNGLRLLRPVREKLA